jgi:hypothetical protein
MRPRASSARSFLQITDDLIDKMPAGPDPTDLNTALPLPLPSLMICELLGVPYEDHEFFQEHAGVTNARFKTPQDAAETTRELRRYISGLIEATMDDPAEDVLSDLAARLKEGDLSLAEAAPLGHILLVAGHDTSANMITWAPRCCSRTPTSSRPCRPPTGIRRRSPSPRSSTSPAGRRSMSRSAGARTSASGKSRPVSNSTSCSAHCSVGCRPCGSRSTSRS